MRGLTHRAVDRAAGVPEGTTSYYFRTRLALLVGVTERLLALDLADAATAPPPAALDLDAVADMVTQIVTYWTGPGRERMLARYEISLESVRHPELRERFLATGAALRATIGEAFAQLGAPDPHRAGRDFAAMLDGLVYDQLAGAGGSRTAAELRATIRQMLAGLLTAPPAAGRAGRVRP
jgi:AcrR family transcriptional regulator